METEFCLSTPGRAAGAVGPRGIRLNARPNEKTAPVQRRRIARYVCPQRRRPRLAIARVILSCRSGRSRWGHWVMAETLSERKGNRKACQPVFRSYALARSKGIRKDVGDTGWGKNSSAPYKPL